MTFLQQGRLQEATPLLGELISLTEGNWQTTVRYWLARTQIDYDQFELGLAELDTVMMADGNSEVTEHSSVLRGYVLARLGKWSESKIQFEAFNRQFPESAYGNYASLSVADCDFHLGDYARAIDNLLLLQPLLQDQEQKEKSLLIISESYIRMELWKDAIINLGKYETLYPESYQIDFIRFRLAFALLKENQKNRALQVLEKISEDSWLSPYKKVLLVELWKSAGQVDQILNAKLQVFTFSPEINQYNLNHRLWAALKLNRWDLFEKDLNLLSGESQPELSLDSLWVQVAQVAVDQGRMKDAARAYRQAVGINQENQKSAWPELVYNAGVTLFKSGKFEDALLQFDRFISDFKGHKLASDAFLYGLESLIQTGQYDTLQTRISLFRDRYVSYYDQIDLIQAENYFRIGLERTGLELIDKKIRYAGSDSIKNKLMYSAARMTLTAGRPDLSLGYIRILNRFSPDFLPESVELMQIIAEYASGSYAYLNNRIRDYRSKYGFQADDWLIPVEIDVLGSRKELNSVLFSGSLVRLKSPESFSLAIKTGSRYLSQDSVRSAVLSPMVFNVVRQFDDAGLFILVAQTGLAAGSQLVKSASLDGEKIANYETLWSGRSNDPGEIGEQIFALSLSRDGAWIKSQVVKKLFFSRPALMVEKWIEDGRIDKYDIDLLRNQLSLSDYARLDTNQVKILIHKGSVPVSAPLKFYFYLGLTRFYAGKSDSVLELFFRKQALKLQSVSFAYSELLHQDLFWTAQVSGWEAFDYYYQAVRSYFPERTRKLIEIKKMTRLADQMPSKEFLPESENWRKNWPGDREIEDQIFLLSVKSLLREKKKTSALKLIKDYDKKYPKTTVVKDARRLFL
ncbi:MAG: hypothetical protein J0L62_02275 [Bacteroidetes bacterium]|nr:hypothetical protein [Bacteroidota bacterium]